MKKATATTVAQSIKSTKQLSPPQGLAPVKSRKPPLKNSCSGLTLDAAQAHQHLDLLGLDETRTNIRLIPHKGRRGGAINGIFANDLDRPQDLNREGYGVYLQVNIACGTKADDVTACTALFCEWDDQPIEEQLVLWQSLGLPEPTFMVMTGGKSVHLYWVLAVPIELSVVSIPADASIGVNRSLPTTTQQPMTSTYETISALNPDEFGHAQRDFSVVCAIQASASGNWSQAGLEREVNQELEHRNGKRTQGFFVPDDCWGKRDYVKSTASAGGNLVATDLLAGNFVEALRDRLAVAELGATMLTGLVGDVSIPKRTGTATAYWFSADNADAVTESTGTIGTISMSPKTVGAYSKFSRLMELQSTPDIEQLIRADFVALLADAIDTAAINGSGSSSQPTGILQTSGIGSVAGGTNGLAPTLDHLLDLKKEVAVDNADIGTCGFLTNAKVESVLAKAKDAQNQYLLSPYGVELGRSQVAGRRLEVSNNVPSNLTKGSGTNLSAVIYGNFADLLIGMFGQLEILVDPYTDFAKGTVGVRVLQTIDIAVRHAESFAAMQDAIA